MFHLRSPHSALCRPHGDLRFALQLGRRIARASRNASQHHSSSASGKAGSQVATRSNTRISRTRSGTPGRHFWKTVWEAHASGDRSRRNAAATRSLPPTASHRTSSSSLQIDGLRRAPLLPFTSIPQSRKAVITRVSTPVNKHLTSQLPNAPRRSMTRRYR